MRGFVRWGAVVVVSLLGVVFFFFLFGGFTEFGGG